MFLNFKYMDIYNIKNLYKNKNCLIICSGASCDYIDKSIVDKYDLVIGINDVWKKYKCDYIVCKEGGKELFERRKNYENEFKLVIRKMTLNNNEDIIFDYSFTGEDIVDNIDFDLNSWIKSDTIFQSRTSLTSGIHVALLLGVKSIDFIGVDVNFCVGNKYYFEGYTEKSELKYLSEGILNSFPNLQNQTEKLLKQAVKIYNIKYNFIYPPNLQRNYNFVNISTLNIYLHKNYEKYSKLINLPKRSKFLSIFEVLTYKKYLEIDHKYGKEIVEECIKLNLKNNNYINNYIKLKKKKNFIKRYLSNFF
jgi:hypothetical protein